MKDYYYCTNKVFWCSWAAGRGLSACSCKRSSQMKCGIEKKKHWLKRGSISPPVSSLILRLILWICPVYTDSFSSDCTLLKICSIRLGSRNQQRLFSILMHRTGTSLLNWIHFNDFIPLAGAPFASIIALMWLGGDQPSVLVKWSSSCFNSCLEWCLD